MTVKTSDPVVLDTFAVLVFLGGEPSAQRVSDVLMNGQPWMTLVNLGEVAYIIERKKGKAAADTVFANLLADEGSDGGNAIQWMPVDASLVRRAASLKSAGGLSYADCFAAAAADILGCSVLTGDPEFIKAEQAGISVEWL